MFRNKTLRLRGFDYTQGAFFITIKTKHNIPLFGKLENQAVVLNEYGEKVREEWLKTAVMRPNVTLDEFQIMQDHFHAIIILHKVSSDKSEFRFTQKLEYITTMGGRTGSLGTIVGLFKGAVTRGINKMNGTKNVPVWLDDYYERIIRNTAELHRIRQYIINNPKKHGTINR